MFELYELSSRYRDFFVIELLVLVDNEYEVEHLVYYRDRQMKFKEYVIENSHIIDETHIELQLSDEEYRCDDVYVLVDCSTWKSTYVPMAASHLYSEALIEAQEILLEAQETLYSELLLNQKK